MNDSDGGAVLQGGWSGKASLQNKIKRLFLIKQLLRGKKKKKLSNDFSQSHSIGETKVGVQGPPQRRYCFSIETPMGYVQGLKGMRNRHSSQSLKHSFKSSQSMVGSR